MLPGGGVGLRVRRARPCPPVLSGRFPGNRGQGDTAWGVGWGGAPHPTRGPAGPGALGEARGGAGLGLLHGNREETLVREGDSGPPRGLRLAVGAGQALRSRDSLRREAASETEVSRGQLSARPLSPWTTTPRQPRGTGARWCSDRAAHGACLRPPPSPGALRPRACCP